MVLAHWGRVTHICVDELTIICSDNGLSPGRRQAITWTNYGLLLIRPLGTNFSEILIEIPIFSFQKIHLKMSSGNQKPFCLDLNVLTVKMSELMEYCPKSVDKGTIIKVLSITPPTIYQTIYFERCLWMALFIKKNRMTHPSSMKRGTITNRRMYTLLINRGRTICALNVSKVLTGHCKNEFKRWHFRTILTLLCTLFKISTEVCNNRVPSISARLVISKSTHSRRWGF